MYGQSRYLLAFIRRTSFFEAASIFFVETFFPLMVVRTVGQVPALAKNLACFVYQIFVRSALVCAQTLVTGAR